MRKEISAVIREWESGPIEPGTRAEGDVWRFGKGRRGRDGSVSVAGRPKIDPNAPYDPAIGALPDAELRRLTDKHRTRSTNRGKAENLKRKEFTVRELSELSGVHYDWIEDYVQGKKTLYPAARIRLSQILLRIEAGLIVRREGKAVKLTVPENPPPKPISRRVLLDGSGRLIVERGDPPPQPRPFPEMLKAWLK